MVSFNGLLLSQQVTDSINLLPENEKAAALLEMTKQYYTSNFALADEYSSQALLIAEKLGQRKEEGLAYKYLGITDYFRRDFDAAHIHYNEALKIFEATDNLLDQSKVISNIAILYSENGDYKTSIEYNEKALKIRKELDDKKGISISYTNIGNLYMSQNLYKKALEYYNKATEISKQSPILLSNIAKCNFEMGNINKAFDAYQKALEAAEESGEIHTIIATKLSFGNYYWSIGEAEKAIKIMSSALELATQNNMEYSSCVLMLNIGNVYYQSEQYNKASEFYNSALPIYVKTKDISGQISCLTNIGLTDEELNLPDSALSKFMLAQKLSKQYSDSSGMASSAKFLGRHYMNYGEFDKSKFWFENAFEIAKANNNKRELYKINYQLGVYWYELEKYDKSIKYLVPANIYAKKQGDVNTQKNITGVLWLCYEKLNEYHLAFNAFKEYYMIKDSIFDKETQTQIRIVEGKLNMQLKESKIKSQKQIIQQQVKILEQEKRNKIYIIVVAVLVLGLIVIIYSREKIRRQKERAILVYEKKLLKTEMEKKELHKKELESELEYKSRQMTTHTLNMMQKNKALREMTIDITNISKKADDNIKQDLKRLKFQLNQSLKADKDWDEFRMYFEEVNRSFFSKLKEINPNISPAEERLAALIKLKMNIKETASVLNISPSSVKMARHRLRQKLNLPQDVDLYDFIGGIG